MFQKRCNLIKKFDLGQEKHLCNIFYNTWFSRKSRLNRLKVEEQDDNHSKRTDQEVERPPASVRRIFPILLKQHLSRLYLWKHRFTLLSPVHHLSPTKCSYQADRIYDNNIWNGRLHYGDIRKKNLAISLTSERDIME